MFNKDKEFVKIVQDPDGYSVKAVYRDGEYFPDSDWERGLFLDDYYLEDYPPPKKYDYLEDFSERLP